MRQQRVIASAIGIATTAAVTLALGPGTAPAGATTRLRSGTLHGQLAGHVSSASGLGSGPLSLAGANVMAVVVATLALLALAFVLVTLIRRRILPA